VTLMKYFLFNVLNKTEIIETQQILFLFRKKSVFYIKSLVLEYKYTNIAYLVRSMIDRILVPVSPEEGAV
jgi:hypothetical protein